MTEQTSNPMPRVTQLGQVTGSLDASKLLEAARVKLNYARGELDRIKREHAMKTVEISENYRTKWEELRRETEDALRFLDQQTTDAAKPAKEMIDLVESMLNYKK